MAALFIWFIAACVFGVFGSALAEDKAMGSTSGGVLGALLGLLGIAIILVSKSKDKAELEKRQLEELRKKQSNN